MVGTKKMKKLSKAEEKRQLILKHTQQLILEQGFDALTIDGVIKHAGISKGGFLYHFPSRESLIEALGSYTVETFYEQLRVFAEDDDGKGKWNRSYIKASFDDLKHNKNLFIGLILNSFLKENEHSETDEYCSKIDERLAQDGLEPITVQLITLTIDGLYHRALFRTDTSISDKEMDTIYTNLLNMTI